MPSAAYAEARAKIAAAKREAQEIAKTVFEDEAKSLLGELEIESFGWTQYTPYFNDGDACVFGVNGDYPDVNGVDEDDYWGTPAYEAQKPLRKRVAEFIMGYDEEDMEFMFGDHVKVTVTKDSIETEEYEHD